MSILTRSGFRFQTTIVNVAVQGISAVPTVLDAFAQLDTHHHQFDVVLLIRGGGSEIDLLAYDEFEVAKAVALSPIPVITGLGHTADQSIADAVSYRSLETPTAAAQFLVDQIQTLQDQLREMRDRLRASAIEQLHHRRRHLLAQRPHFVRHALSRVHDRQRHRVEQWHALYTIVRDYLQQHRRLLDERHQPVALQARRILQTHHTFLSQRFGTVLTAAATLIAARRYGLRTWRQTLPLTTLSRMVAPARSRLGGIRHHIHHLGCDMVRRALIHLHRLHAHIEAANPERYFALGLSYVTRSDGSVLKSRAHVSEGEHLEIHLADGIVPAAVTTQEHHDH
jgi:exodeoxyribonuclease VII large subunit